MLRPRVFVSGEIVDEKFTQGLKNSPGWEMEFVCFFRFRSFGFSFPPPACNVCASSVCRSFVRVTQNLCTRSLGARTSPRDGREGGRVSAAFVYTTRAGRGPASGIVRTRSSRAGVRTRADREPAGGRKHSRNFFPHRLWLPVPS